MIKKSVTYTDLDGNKVTEDHYFHMSKADIAKYKLKHGGDITRRIRELIAKKDAGQMILIFEEILTESYGKRSDDGRRFIKDADKTKEFKESEAYSQIFYELATGAQESADFIKGMLPADMVSEIPDLPDDPDQLLAVFDKLAAEEEQGPTGGGKAITLPVQQEAPPLVLPPGGDGKVVETSPLGVVDKDPFDYTLQELMDMPRDRFDQVIGTDHTKWSRTMRNAWFQRDLAQGEPQK